MLIKILSLALKCLSDYLLNIAASSLFNLQPMIFEDPIGYLFLYAVKYAVKLLIDPCLIWLYEVTVNGISSPQETLTRAKIDTRHNSLSPKDEETGVQTDELDENAFPQDQVTVVQMDTLDESLSQMVTFGSLV